MSRKNTQTLNRIRRLCRIRNLDETVLYTRSKLILSAYRDICWSTAGRADQVREDLTYYCSSQLDDALIYLETFAPDEARENFEEQVKTLFETRWMIRLVEDTMVQVRNYPCNGDLYCKILSRCYLGCMNTGKRSFWRFSIWSAVHFMIRKKKLFWCSDCRCGGLISQR